MFKIDYYKLYKKFRKVYVSRLLFIFRNKKFSLLKELFKDQDKDFWINYKAKKWFLENAKNKRVFEWGAGYSTEHINKVAKEIISVEHNKEWLKNISVDSKIIFAENKKDYVNAIENKGKFDIVFVDGIFRRECILKAMDYVKKNGFLVIDDVNNNPINRFGDYFENFYVDKLHFRIGGFKSNTGGYWETGIIINH